MNKNLVGVIAGLLIGLIVGAGAMYTSQHSEELLGYSNSEFKVVVDGATSTTTGEIFNVTEFDRVSVEVSTANSATLTVKALGSIETTKPDFSASQSYTNVWDYQQMIDTEDGSVIDGDTGVSVAGTDDYRIFNVNTDGLRWLTVNVTAWTAGTSTVKIRGFAK